MKIFVPSLRRPQRIQIHKWLEGHFNYVISVHDQEEYDAYLQNKTIPPNRLVITGQPKTMIAQRQWAKEQCKEGEWYCMIDDKVISFEAVHPSEYFDEDLSLKYPARFQKNDNTWRKEFFDHPASQDRMKEIFKETISKAESIGAHYAGFATQRNYFFGRGRKWGYYGYVQGKCCLMKKGKLDYDQNILTMDDYAFTAQNILEYGTVLINRYAYAVGMHYLDGGCGNYKERLPKKISDCKYLMEKYHGLFRYAKKKSAHPEAELMIRLCYEKQIEKWRKEMQCQKMTGLQNSSNSALKGNQYIIEGLF